MAKPFRPRWTSSAKFLLEVDSALPNVDKEAQLMRAFSRVVKGEVCVCVAVTMTLEAFHGKGPAFASWPRKVCWPFAATLASNASSSLGIVLLPLYFRK